MGKYLDKFRGTLGQRQTDQIFKLLNKQRNAGQIRSIDEFTRRLDTLIRELTGTVIQPSLKLYPATPNTKTSSEQFNYMLDRVQDDLEAAFEETLNINEVQISHETLVRDVILKNLRAGLAELESKVSLYEFINKDTHGFDNNLFNTFRESKEGRTQRGILDTNTLFVDPRTQELFDSSQDATVELVGERLTLAASSKTFHTIHNVRQIFDSTFPQSDKLVSPPDIELRNIIDGQTGTYWSQTWLYQEAQLYVKSKLEFDLGVTREINFIEIEPIATEGFYLNTIHYIDGNGIIQLLDTPDLLLTGTAGIRIRKISTRYLILTFKNENGKLTNFEFDSKNTLLDQNTITKQQGIQNPARMADIPNMDNLISSVQIQNILKLPTEEKEIYNGYEFVIGFDNIRVGLADYNSSSIFVSTALETSSASVLGLRTTESRPYVNNYEYNRVYRRHI